MKTAPQTTRQPEMRQLETKSKRDELSDQIAHLACRLGAGARLPRVLEMCREFNVATHTLNHALREVEAQGLITRQRGSGIFVTESAARLEARAPIALICRPSLFRAAGHSPVWDLLMDMIEQRAAATGLHFDCYFSREWGCEPALSKAVEKAIEERHIGGVLGVGLPEAGALWMMSRGVPVVNLFGRGNVTVNLDSESIVRHSVSALVTHGCRKIGLWMPVSGQTAAASMEEQVRYSQQQNKEFFVKALHENGLRCTEKLIEGGIQRLENRDLASHATQGFETAQRVFSRPRAQWPDGIVSTDDMMTAGILEALASLQLEVGRDVYVASHANSGSLVLAGNRVLDLVEVDPQDIVAIMFQRIEHLMSKPLDDWKKEEIVLIPARLRPAGEVLPHNVKTSISANSAVAKKKVTATKNTNSTKLSVA